MIANERNQASRKVCSLQRPRDHAIEHLDNVNRRLGNPPMSGEVSQKEIEEGKGEPRTNPPQVVPRPARGDRLHLGPPRTPPGVRQGGKNPPARPQGPSTAPPD